MQIANRIVQGDCTGVLKTVPDESADFILTDPPYFVGYKDRNGRTIANDTNPESILGAFSDLYRILKPDSVCVSFYGWNSVDSFFHFWKEAGFKPIGHIVWHKNYTSRAGFLNAQHEQAYVLAKGRPKKPKQPLDDVRAWEYSGNRVHPTEKAISVLQPLIEAFSRPGELVLDPFSGSGSTLVAAALLKRHYLGIELESRYCELAKKRLAGIENFLQQRKVA